MNPKVPPDSMMIALTFSIICLNSSTIPPSTNFPVFGLIPNCPETCKVWLEFLTRIACERVIFHRGQTLWKYRPDCRARQVLQPLLNVFVFSPFSICYQTCFWRSLWTSISIEKVLKILFIDWLDKRLFFRFSANNSKKIARNLWN